MNAVAKPSGERLALLDDTTASGFKLELIRYLVDDSHTVMQKMYRPAGRAFVQTMRRDPAQPGQLKQEGSNERYAAIVALGLARFDTYHQREILTGTTAEQLVDYVASRALRSTDRGILALAAWASAEVRNSIPAPLFDRLVAVVHTKRSQDTVSYAWTLTALAESIGLADVAAVTEQAVDRLLASQEPSGLFPHALPRRTLGPVRTHVACFADQVYPVQALARYWRATGDERALVAANRCAAVIVDRQGPSGQWWWHYDVRTGDVIEGYPVYSVHQHAMGPMALFDLYEVGGNDHRQAILAGLRWLWNRPETTTELLDHSTGAIWRKVGRREPRKLVRSVRATATAAWPQSRLRLLDRVFPPGVVDYECRPYELGWLLYAWLPKATEAASQSLSAGRNRQDAG